MRHKVLQKVESWLSVMPRRLCLPQGVPDSGVLRVVHATPRICGLRKAGGTKLHNVGPSAMQK